MEMKGLPQFGQAFLKPEQCFLVCGSHHFTEAVTNCIMI